MTAFNSAGANIDVDRINGTNTDEANTWLPLTAAQEGILAGQLLAADSPMYNAAEFIEITGVLDLAALTQAITQVINAAESLHVQYRYGMDNSTPAMQRLSVNPWMLHTLDVSDNSHPQQVATLWMQNDLNGLTDLRQGPLFTQAIFVLSPVRIIWYQRIHHIACDGYGFALIAQNVAALYDQIINNTLLPAPIFGDYQKIISTDADYKKSQKYKSDKEFWCTALANNPPPVTLHPFSSLQDSSCNVNTILPASLVATIKNLANEYSCAWPDIIYALCAQWLMFKTGRSHITLGIPIMVRMGTPAVRVPAMVMNIQPLPIAMQNCDSFDDVVEQVVNFLRQARRHQHYRYEQLRRDLGVVGGNKRLFGPVVNIMPFNRRLNFGEAQTQVQRLSAGPVEDLSIALHFNHQDDLVLSLEANPAAYTLEQLQTYQRELIKLMTTYSQQPSKKIELDLDQLAFFLGDNVIANTVLENSGNDDSDNRFLPVLTAILKHANARPTAIALTEGDCHLNYQQLVARIMLAATHLQAAKSLSSRIPLGHNIVAIVASRSSASIIASLAVLLSGDAYLFIDPSAPIDRNLAILHNAQPAVVIADESWTINATQENVEGPLLLALSQLEHPQLEKPQLEKPELNSISDFNNSLLKASQAQPHDLAYLMYTSGSTGKPKGVKIGHGALASFVQSALQAYGICAQDKILQFAPLHFDASIEEIYLTLVQGAQLILRSDAMLDAMADFLQAISQAQITVLDLPTAFWHELVLYCVNTQQQLPASVRIVIIGGEAAQPERVKQWHEALGQNITLFNTYGPTETTVVATYAKLLSGHAVTIGRPLPGRSIAVVNDEGELVARGTPGELIILGAGIGLGYHQLPEQSAQRFAPLKALRDPRFSEAYRTGDRVILLSSGELEYLGRLDDEVKISGYRIHPLEIENALLALPKVSQAAVIVASSANGPILHAFVALAPQPVPASDSVEAIQQLRALLREKLPAPMVPSQFYVLARLPINHNGKVDKQQLKRELKERLEQPTAAATSGPQAIVFSATEQKIATVWQSVLGLEAIAPDDDFFVLGGQSLQTLQVASRLSTVFTGTINVTNLFKYPTLRQLADFLDGNSLVGSLESSLAKIQAQALADSHIKQAVAPLYLARPIKQVLVTGGNGFVGVHLVQQLRHCGIKVICLLRAHSCEHAEQRLSAAFADQQLSWSAIADGVSLVVGDAAHAQLGLSAADYAALLTRVDAVVHNAASTSVMRDYQSLTAANVLATQQCFALAAAAGVPMHLISTVAVAPASGLPEDFVPWHSGLRDGYQQSKWAAENCMANAQALGYPVSVYRLARVTGASLSGYINERDLAWRMIRASTLVGQYPDIDLVEPWSQADQVARFVVAQVVHNSDFGVYNPVPNHKVPLAQIYSWLQAEGFALTPAAMPVWLARLQQQSDEGCQALASFFEQRLQAGGELLLPAITTTQTQRLLRQYGVHFSPLTQAAFKRYLAFAVANGRVAPRAIERLELAYGKG